MAEEKKEPTFRIDVQVGAEKLVDYLREEHERVSKEINAGVKSAVDNFDFKKATEIASITIISNVILDQLNKSGAAEKIRSQIKPLIDKFISDLKSK